MPAAPDRALVAVPNPHPDREYEVELVCPEFTCVCPMTGQPDFATFTIRYVPGPSIVELKSLKLYLWSYREEGAFHEDVTNRVLDDLVRCVGPRRMRIASKWNVRGGIETTVRAEYVDGKRLTAWGEGPIVPGDPTLAALWGDPPRSQGETTSW
jgi:7-cyano-7-deazaguanine reductase